MQTKITLFTSYQMSMSSLSGRKNKLDMDFIVSLFITQIIFLHC